MTCARCGLTLGYECERKHWQSLCWRCEWEWITLAKQTLEAGRIKIELLLSWLGVFGAGFWSWWFIVRCVRAAMFR